MKAGDASKRLAIPMSLNPRFMIEHRLQPVLWHNLSVPHEPTLP